MFGLILLLVALVTFTCTAFCTCSQIGIKLGTWSSLGASLLSGFLAIIASATFGNSVRDADEDICTFFGYSPMKTSYSLIITGVGGLLAAVLALILALTWLIYTKPCRREPESQPWFVLNPDPVVPMVPVYPPNYVINQGTTPAVLQPTFQGMPSDPYKTTL